jgi:hypothetical protein
MACALRRASSPQPDKGDGKVERDTARVPPSHTLGGGEIGKTISSSTVFATVARRTRPARSSSVLRVHPQMERPGFEPPLCAQSTNRRLYAIYSQIPLDNCASLHRRRMTGWWRGKEGGLAALDTPRSLRQGQQQVPCGNDRQKGKGKGRFPSDFIAGAPDGGVGGSTRGR